jgi:rRNA maturation RNase YbeY
MVTVEVIESEEVEGLLPVETDRMESFAREVLERNGVERGEYNIVFIGDAYMTELNEIYKGRIGTTDVLSFNLSDENENVYAGEVYVSLERAKEQAEEYGASFEREVVRLVVHGLLHLSGYVHDTEELFASMNGRTEDIVAAFFQSRG